MLQTHDRYDDHSEDILERLRHPEREHQRKRMSRNLFIRNILNSVFILVAVVAMIGIVATHSSPKSMIWYGVGLFAVLIKMVEVVLRMPGLKKSAQRPRLGCIQGVALLPLPSPKRAYLYI